MKSPIAGLSAVVLATVVPGAVWAEDARIAISGHVDIMCRIEASSTAPIVIRDGQAALGPVQEMCNTPEGYQVRSSFTNLAAGKLVVGGVRYPLNDGWAVRAIAHPAALEQNWALIDATPVDATQAVLMQVSIAPL